MLFALLAVTLVLRLVVALADHRSLIGLDLYQDDAFYYLKIAQNVVAGRGLTFDGQTATSGFHPLYLLLLLPIVAASGTSLVAPIHASAVLLALVAVVTGWLVFRLGGLSALALWAVSPYFIAYGVNGLETGLAMLFAVGLITVYTVSPARPVLLGILAGLAVLARFDLVLLVAAVAVDGLVRPARRALVARMLGVALAIWLPWGAFSYFATGSAWPASGAATRQIALEYGWKNLQSFWAEKRVAQGQWFDPEDVPAAYHADVATQQALVFLFEQPLLSPLRLHLPFSVWPRLDRYLPYAGFRAAPAAGLVVALLLVVLALRRQHLALLVYLGLTFVGYTFYCPAHWYYPRYLAPAVLLTLVLGLVQLRAWVRPRGVQVAGMALLLLGQLALFRGSTFSDLSWRETEPGGFLRAWRLLEPRIDRSKRLGAFQAGCFSWFGRRDVVNLDGKVNPDAQRALERHDLAGYIARAEIDYILDWPWVLESLCLRHARPGELRIREIAREPDGYGFVLYGLD